MGTLRKNIARREMGEPQMNKKIDSKELGTPGQVLVDVQHLEKRYGSTVAVRDVSFTLHQGEVLALVGRNGAGKTTLMRMIADESEPSSGSIHHTTNHLMYVPDETILYEHLTGREFLHFICVMSGIDKRQMKEVVTTHLEKCHLIKSSNQLTKTYSLGMRRQLSIAAALIKNPDILILDEITNGLDPVANAEVKQQLRSLANQGTAILLSSHLLDVVGDIADRILVMDAGAIRYVGPLPESVRDVTGSRNQSLEQFYLSLLSHEEAES